MLEAQQEGGKIILIPKTLVNSAPVQKLTEHEQNAEIRMAVKAGLIDHDTSVLVAQELAEGRKRGRKRHYGRTCFRGCMILLKTR